MKYGLGFKGGQNKDKTTIVRASGQDVDLPKSSLARHGYGKAYQSYNECCLLMDFTRTLSALANFVTRTGIFALQSTAATSWPTKNNVLSQQAYKDGRCSRTFKVESRDNGELLHMDLIGPTQTDRHPTAKFEPKSDERIFLRYSSNSHVYRVYNNVTNSIMESTNMVVDDQPDDLVENSCPGADREYSSTPKPPNADPTPPTPVSATTPENTNSESESDQESNGMDIPTHVQKNHPIKNII
nr:retrotransposon-related protein [Ipomoea batatas]